MGIETRQYHLNWLMRQGATSGRAHRLVDIKVQHFSDGEYFHPLSKKSVDNVWELTQGIRLSNSQWWPGQKISLASTVVVSSEPDWRWRPNAPKNSSPWLKTINTITYGRQPGERANVWWPVEVGYHFDQVLAIWKAMVSRAGDEQTFISPWLVCVYFKQTQTWPGAIPWEENYKIPLFLEGSPLRLRWGNRNEVIERLDLHSKVS